MEKAYKLLDSEQALHYFLSPLDTKAGYVYSRWRGRHPPHQPTRKNIMYSNQRLVFVAAALLLVAAFGNFSLLSAGQTISSAGLVSYYAVQRTATPIVVDGSLGEFAWQAAEQIDGFERILSDYDRVLSPVRAKMLWDDEHFYFGFACRDDSLERYGGDTYVAFGRQRNRTPEGQERGADRSGSTVDDLVDFPAFVHQALGIGSLDGYGANGRV